MVSANAAFCPHCRHQFKATAPDVEMQHWAKEPTDFAARIDVRDLRGALRKDLIVEPGTRAIILVDGRNKDGELGPGRYTLDDSLRASPRWASADDHRHSGGCRRRGSLLLAARCTTSDPLRVTLNMQILTRLDNAFSFSQA